MYDLRITSASIVGFAQHIGFSLEPQGGCACAAWSSMHHEAPTCREHDGAPARTCQRRVRADVQPLRAAQPLVRGQWGSCTQLLGVHSPRQLSLQSGLAESADVPRRERRIRRRRLQGCRRGRLHRPGDHRRQRRLPDREDRRDDAAFRELGIGYANLGRAADGGGPSVRLRRRPGLGGRHHGAVDRPRLRHVGPHRRPHGSLRRVPREQRADAERAAHAPGRDGARSTRTSCRPSCCRRRRSHGTRRSNWPSSTACEFAGQRFGADGLPGWRDARVHRSGSRPPALAGRPRRHAMAGPRDRRGNGRGTAGGPRSSM